MIVLQVWEDRNPHPYCASCHHWESVPRIGSRAAQDPVPRGAGRVSEDPQVGAFLAPPSTSRAQSALLSFLLQQLKSRAHFPSACLWECCIVVSSHVARCVTKPLTCVYYHFGSFRGKDTFLVVKKKSKGRYLSSPIIARRWVVAYTWRLCEDFSERQCFSKWSL